MFGRATNIDFLALSRNVRLGAVSWLQPVPDNGLHQILSSNKSLHTTASRPVTSLSWPVPSEENSVTLYEVPTSCDRVYGGVPCTLSQTHPETIILPQTSYELVRLASCDRVYGGVPCTLSQTHPETIILPQTSYELVRLASCDRVYGGVPCTLSQTHPETIILPQTSYELPTHQVYSSLQINHDEMAARYRCVMLRQSDPLSYTGSCNRSRRFPEKITPWPVLRNIKSSCRYITVSGAAR
ncbi:hypothetical protein RRG08_018501 [Elysia crispata]|uniref:Uncharacterized protein n=1 Tax=Elysia crispata TaxID=231223 RepID=A0AAE0Y2A2_9GAST|nr:hypothetical protein RRG08_018501 [Elysia crispata]